MLDPDAVVPAELVHDRFVAVPLTIGLADLDYEAYLASPDVIRVHSDGRWHVDGFTRTEDLEQVARHEFDHLARRAFTFALLTPSLTESLGCLYLNPLRDYLERVGAATDTVPEASAIVTLWLRQDRQDADLAQAVVAAVNGWLRDDWPLALSLFRVLPDEQSSRAALEGLGLHRVHPVLPDEPRPYLWFRAG